MGSLNTNWRVKYYLFITANELVQSITERNDCTTFLEKLSKAEDLKSANTFSV